MLRGTKTTSPHDRLRKALQFGQHSEALRLYALLQEHEPNEPRWPRRKGDLLLRMNRKPEAIEAYERAVELYAARGFIERAAAMAKVVINIDSSRIDVLERFYPDQAQRPHRAY
jgi:predicted Zn-dependent protease